MYFALTLRRDESKVSTVMTQFLQLQRFLLNTKAIDYHYRASGRDGFTHCDLRISRMEPGNSLQNVFLAECVVNVLPICTTHRD